MTRSSILTGKYTHNHKTYENTVERGCDAPSWRLLNENKTMGLYMSMAGYKTAFFGRCVGGVCMCMRTCIMYECVLHMKKLSVSHMQYYSTV